MNRIDKKFQQLKKENKKALIPFITAGFPDLGTTEKLVLEFENSGADIIELGAPFSDPLADGRTIQEASFKALKKGVNFKKIFDTVSKIRKNSQIPIAVMTYYNPIFHYGETRFVSDAKKCGVDGLIVPDLPPEEASVLIKEAKKNEISTIFFLSPTTTEKRIRNIIKASTGFIYYVSVTGVTGSRQEIPISIIEKVKGVKKITNKPICVGFGISTAEQVKKISSVADGVIIGSAIINEIFKNQERKDLVKKVSFFVKKMTK